MESRISGSAISQLTIKAGTLTMRTPLPGNELECAEKIMEITVAANNSTQRMLVSMGEIDDHCFTPWEAAYHKKHSVSIENSFTLGAVLFIMLFHRPPERQEMTLHRQIDYSTSAFELSDGFALAADDYLRHSLAISPACRCVADDLLAIADKLVEEAEKSNSQTQKTSMI